MLTCMLGGVIRVRKLVAIELAFLGPKIIVAEYAIAVVGGLFLGLLSLRAGLTHTHATWQISLGIYLLFLALNYAVLLGCATAMARRGDARKEIADELDDKAAAFRKYRRQSVWLLVPLAVPFAAMKEKRGLTG
jgi:hypothetical protein